MNGRPSQSPARSGSARAAGREAIGLAACLLLATACFLRTPSPAEPPPPIAQPSPPSATPSPARPAPPPVPEDCERARTHFDRAAGMADREEQIYFLKMGLRVCPSDARAHADLGEAYLAQKRRAEARTELEEALRLDPSLGEARRALESLGNR